VDLQCPLLEQELDCSPNVPAGMLRAYELWLMMAKRSSASPSGTRETRVTVTVRLMWRNGAAPRWRRSCLRKTRARTWAASSRCLADSGLSRPVGPSLRSGALRLGAAQTLRRAGPRGHLRLPPDDRSFASFSLLETLFGTIRL
jgi:hypothetical protein